MIEELMVMAMMMITMDGVDGPFFQVPLFNSVSLRRRHFRSIKGKKI